MKARPPVDETRTSEDPAGTLLALAASVAAHLGEIGSIAGGPVDVPLDALPRLVRMALFLDPAAQPYVTVELPDGAVFEFPELSPLTPVRAARDGRFVVLAPDAAEGQALEGLTRIAHLLAEVPEGSALALRIASDLRGARVGYEGVVAAAGWRVERSHPPQPAIELKTSLGLE